MHIYILHETEALSILSRVDNLKYGISREFEEGLGELPFVYTSDFISPFPFNLQNLTVYLKQWFLVVRSGKESCTIDDELDEFSANISFISRVGLKVLS